MNHSSLNTIAYATIYEGMNGLVKFDFGDHSMEVIASGGIPWPYAEDTGLAINSKGQLFAIGEGGGLYQINKTTGVGTFIGETGIGVQTFGADFIGDELIAVLSNDDGSRFFSVDTQTANATAFLHLPEVRMESFTIVSPDSIFFVHNNLLKILNPYTHTITDIGPNQSNVVDFGPDGNLYGMRYGANEIYRINPYTGATTPLITDLPVASTEWSGLAVAPVMESPLLEIVSVASERNYQIVDLVLGSKVYIDRGYAITSFSDELSNALLIQTANDDKAQNQKPFLILRLNDTADVYVAYDHRGSKTPPNWLNDGSWERSGLNVASTDSPALPYTVFSKRVTPGYITLGSNHDGGDTGARSQYFVMAK